MSPDTSPDSDGVANRVEPAVGHLLAATAPGRVNLIGDHTDYMGGPVLPMAIQMRTTITATVGGDRLRLSSTGFPGEVDLALPVIDPASVEPTWGRYVAGVAAELGARVGLRGKVDSDLPAGSGLSSSAALEVATALALGDRSAPAELARRCQLAEQRASGVPCGVMDQLVVATGREGHAVLIDCATGGVAHIPVPDDAQLHVVHSGASRELAGSAYAERRGEAEAAAALVGPLPTATPADIDGIRDPTLRRRARHVRSESERVHECAEALTSCDLVTVGRLMSASHASLRDDVEVSTDALDTLVSDLVGRPGVLGARLTGAGFGGCVVVLSRPGTELPGWRVAPSAGARVEDLGPTD